MREEIYTLKNTYDGIEYTFFSSAMVRFAILSNMPIQTAVISQEAINRILAGDTIEPERLRCASADDNNPITIVEWPTGQGHAIVDGNHRVIRRHMAGVHSVRAWVWPLGSWEDFVLRDENTPLIIMIKAMELAQCPR